MNVQGHEFSFDEQVASVTISFGVAEITDNESLDELFARVDAALFLAKSEGRNRAKISYYINVQIGVCTSRSALTQELLLQV